MAKDSNLQNPVDPVSTSMPHDFSDGGSERKPVTVLFSDLSGYSLLCEQLDPEDVSEMMSLVFKEIVGIIIRYEGYIDRIIGDEVLAVFGIPHIHEDDPIRAIRAALDIHATVAGMTDRFKGRLLKPLAMHSGIATGLVVTGEIDLATGRHGITGETVNRAALLTHLAAFDEILVENCTMASTSGFFQFEKHIYAAGKRPSDTIDAYRVLSIEKRPDKTRRLQGLRSRLIGRESEMQALQEALAIVSQGSGGCVFLEGDVGTGKSRLISEFKQAIASGDVDWLQGNAYSYTQGVPYYPVIDLLGRAVDVRENDSESEVRRKLIEELSPLEGEAGSVEQILDRLFTLSGDNRVGIRPEAWKLNLRRALIQMIYNQSHRNVTIICIEDLHWADPSTVELFRSLLNLADLPVLVVVSYRPAQLAFNCHKITNPYYRRQTILLGDLSLDQGEAMVKSILQTEHVPPSLMNFIAEHLGGNPFYIEEMINSLIDSGILRKDGAAWQLIGTIDDTVFSSNISTVIAARLDRLGDVTKRIVQEASVIGRRFSPAVLKRISNHPDLVDHSLDILKLLGMVQTSDDPGENLFQFKHALVQEVLYNSLLKQQRRILHEKIARVLEGQRPDRIDALCETLAYHFSKGHSLAKAVSYLVKSGHKGLRKYAVTESHNYFQMAYQILADGDRPVADSVRQTLELLLTWFLVFHLRGRYEDILSLLKRHEPLARASDDRYLKGMYLAHMGWAYQRRERLDQSREVLLEALKIGEQIGNFKVIAYASACLIWTCTDQGRLDDALTFAAKAEKASRLFASDDPTWSFAMGQNLVRFVLTGAAVASWFKGDCGQCRHLGDRLLAYGKKAGDVNSISEGHLAHGMGCFAAGDFRGAIEKCKTAIDHTADPLFTFNARFLMAYAKLGIGELSQAEKDLDAIIGFCRSSGYEYIGSSADALSSIISVAKGNIGKGIQAINRHLGRYEKNGKLYHAQTFHYLLGGIYLRMALREGKMSLSVLIKNLPFLVFQLPRAAKQAQAHLTTAIDIAGRINALGIKAQACLDLGRLHQARKNNDLARPLIRESIALFEQLGAEEHLKRARAAMSRLE